MPLRSQAPTTGPQKITRPALLPRPRPAERFAGAFRLGETFRLPELTGDLLSESATPRCAVDAYSYVYMEHAY